MNKSHLLPLLIIIVGLGISAALFFGNRAPVAPASTTAKVTTNEPVAENAKVTANQPVAENLRRVDLEIKGLFCIGCRSSVVSSVTALPGVLQADADPRTDSGWVIYDPSQITKEQIVATPIFQAYPASILDDQPFEQAVNQKQAIQIPPEIEEKLNLLAKKLSERGVTLESFFQQELDEALSQGYFDKANNLLDNYLEAYE